MPCEMGCAEAVRHSDVMGREAVSPKELNHGWGQLLSQAFLLLFYIHWPRAFV